MMVVDGGGLGDVEGRAPSPATAVVRGLVAAGRTIFSLLSYPLSSMPQLSAAAAPPPPSSAAVVVEALVKAAAAAAAATPALASCDNRSPQRLGVPRPHAHCSSLPL
ncbi:hypothetical protein NL676_005560 [Syzygium grande]|nr:hypothetical protein NL676_005560 [Syzygium grande]